MRPIHRSFCRVLFLWLSMVAMAPAQQPVPLISSSEPAAGWKFNNGAEFPGATGSVSADAQALHNGQPSLKIAADFSKGGNYVDAGRKIDGVDIGAISMWVRNPGQESFTLRINDASGQTHQIALKTGSGPDWQNIVLPLERFFSRRGEADAVPGIARYESWGGAKDGNWHGPATAIYVVIGAADRSVPRAFWLSELTILPRVAEAPAVDVASTVALDDLVEGAHDWGLSLGEVKGARGTLSVASEAPEPGQTSLKLEADFSAGGAYVAAIKNLRELALKDVTAFTLKVKSANVEAVTVALVDGSGQTHQRKGIRINGDGQWHEWTIKPSDIAGGEHWGGANDARWHGAPRQFVISLTNQSAPDSKAPVLFLAEIRADALVAGAARAAAFDENFEGTPASGWKLGAGVKVDDGEGWKSGHSLKLSRSVDDAARPCEALSPSFSVVPGQWEVSLASKAALESPDNSYRAVVTLDCLDGAGAVLERLPLIEVFGRRDWTENRQRIELAKGAVSARFSVQLEKCWGEFRVDGFSAAYLAPLAKKDDSIVRLVFTSAQLGNLLFPNDSRRIAISVEARKALRDEQKTLSCVVRDYWGAEQTRPMKVALGAPEKKGALLIYTGECDLIGAALELGRYYELHAELARDGGDPFRHHTSLAILPEAATKAFKPEEIPFTSRSWDNRISEYIKLSARLGIRICGLWGSWSDKPPYAAEVPGLELCEKLGMGWLTTTAAASIEQGEKRYDETALRTGVRNLIEKFGQVRPLIINLGNEPHGSGQRVLNNVAAYRAVYQEVKKLDPGIPVIATSVEPNEEYFKAGYGKWCDAYDFHIYESASDVRRTMGEYKVLMAKYGVVKPIWSTELGLNSQGMTRQSVAVELIKKFATFFASGGTNVSWFGLLYPDGEGKLHGTSGDSHNIFDCRFNRYAPRLDAIAYYDAVNSIAAKKFIAEKLYAQGISAFLLRDGAGRALQVLWKDHGRQEVALAVSGAVEIIRLDGSRRQFTAANPGLTLSIGEEPVLVLYEGGAETLPETLGAPIATLQAPESISRHAESILKVTLTAAAASAEVSAPPFWLVKKSALSSTTQQFTLTPPAGTAAREAEFYVTLRDKAGHQTGELSLHLPLSE